MKERLLQSGKESKQEPFVSRLVHSLASALAFHYGERVQLLPTAVVGNVRNIFFYFSPLLSFLNFFLTSSLNLYLQVFFSYETSTQLIQAFCVYLSYLLRCAKPAP